MFWAGGGGRVALQPAVLVWWWASIAASTAINVAMMVRWSSSGGILRAHEEVGAVFVHSSSLRCVLTELASVEVGPVMMHGSF